jgi:hypothetical protein
MGDIVPRFMNLDESPMKLIQPWNLGMCIPKVAYYSIVSHQILSFMAFLMQDGLKITSSHIALLLQFHHKTSYKTTFSCFMFQLQ